METIAFIGLLAMTWLFVTGAESIQFFKKIFGVHEDDKPKDIHLRVIRGAINCCLCSGFWIGLGYYIWHQDQIDDHFFLMACIVSVSAELFSRVIKEIFARI